MSNWDDYGYQRATVHESLQDRIVRMFAEVWLTDARLAEVVAEWAWMEGES